MEDLISIIVPIYNTSEYLSQCIDSIISQTYSELEIILIDDGSTDNSLQICMEYQKSDERIKVIHQENGGSVAARRSGLEAARGVYIGFVDADDYIEPDMFEKLYASITEFHVDFVHSGMIVDHTKFCEYKGGVTDLTIQDRADYINKVIFEQQTLFPALWSKLFQADLVKEAFEKIPEEQSYGEDLLCLCRCLFKCRSVYMLPDAYYHYRIYDGSLSHLNWVDTCIKESQLFMQVIALLKKNGFGGICGTSAKNRCEKRILHVMAQEPSGKIGILSYRFAAAEKLKGKKVALYGAGTVGKDYYRQFSRTGQCEVTAWVDRHNYGVWNLIPIEKPDALKNATYDVLIIAVKNKTVADEIQEDLTQNEICKNGAVVLWEEPVSTWQD